MHQPEENNAHKHNNDRDRDRDRDRNKRDRGGDKAPNKRERRKKEKDEEERKEREPPPVKPLLLSTQEFPSLGTAAVAPVEPRSVAPKESEGFWERPPRPMEVPVAAPTAESVEKKSPPVVPLDDKSKGLPRRKRGKGIAADPKMLGFVAPHRGGAIDHGD